MAEYCNIPLFQVYEMDVFTFWTVLHDVIVYNRSQTKEGRKWLRNAWRIRQTEPETEKLHRKAGKGGKTQYGRANN